MYRRLPASFYFVLAIGCIPQFSNADPGLVGDWQLRVEGRRGIQTPILNMKERDGHFSGRIGGSRGYAEIENVTVTDEGFSFPFHMTTPMGEFNLLYKGRRQGDSITGTVDAPRGEIPFSGTRIVAD